MQAYLKVVGEWLLKAWTILDRRADRKIGFLSGPLFTSLLGGGIPAFLASRGLIYGAIALGAWLLIGNYNDGIRDARDREWEAKLLKQVQAARLLRERERVKINARISVVDTAWNETFAKMTERNKELEAILKETNHENDALTDKLDQTQCVPQKAVNVLRLKVRDVNGRPLK